MGSSYKRIIVLGCSGAGKSTFARMAGGALNLPVYHLDQLFWQPNWVEGEEETFLPKVERITAQEHWIVDGGYSQTWPYSFPRADAVVLLDIPRWRCITGVLWRIATTYGKVREDSAPGCPERLDWEFLRYVWTWKAEREPMTLEAISSRRKDCAFFRITNRRQMKDVIEQMEHPR